jgi:hypothetical protein
MRNHKKAAEDAVVVKLLGREEWASKQETKWRLGMRVLKLLVQRSRPPFPQARTAPVREPSCTCRSRPQQAWTPAKQVIYRNRAPVATKVLIAHEPGYSAEPYCKIRCTKRGSTLSFNYPACCCWVGFNARYYDVSGSKPLPQPVS